MLEIGSVLDGKYKILSEIGRGGMSIVYLAMNEKANKPWAVKEVRKDGVKDYEAVHQGLIAETEILKRLNHPNLPSIVDVIDRDDTFLIVMDYIEGKSLDYWLKKDGAQPQEKVVEWAKQMCDVLGYLHSCNPPIIYRDLKPGNIMLKPDGNIMIIDFGTAREYKETSIDDTRHLGTRGYAAPEQFDDTTGMNPHGQTDARTDIYTLGATLYHLITGHNPCVYPYKMYPIRQWDPSLSTGLEKIIRKCTQENPDDRYQNCAELMYALEHYTELDSTYRKKQQKKLRKFVATTVVAVAAFIGFIGFHAADQKEAAADYDNLVDAGNDFKEHDENSNNIDGNTAVEIYNEVFEKEISGDGLTDDDCFNYAEDCYQMAIKEDPKQSKAYMELMDLYAYGIDEKDRTLSLTELEKLSSYVTVEKDEDSGTYYVAECDFEEGNEEDFGEYCYYLGICYYFKSDGSTSYPKKKAAKYFGLVEDQGLYTTETDEYRISHLLREIGESLAKIESKSDTNERIYDIGSNDNYTYEDYWESLSGLLDEAENILADASGDTSDKITELAYYVSYEVAGELSQYRKEFSNDGITETEMKDVIERLRSVSDDIEKTGVRSTNKFNGQIDYAEGKINALFG